MPLWGWIVIGVLALIIVWLIAAMIAFGNLAGGLLDAVSRGMISATRKQKKWWQIWK